MREVIRSVRFSPYRKGMGPTYTLTLIDVNRRGSRGRSALAYILKRNGKHLFEGSGFEPGHGHADDSDETVRSLMTFLTLRKGDTDAEYFSHYTREQLEWRDSEAEALSMAVYDRFGER